MSIFERMRTAVIGRMKKKEVGIEGTIDLLGRLIPQGMSRTKMLDQYNKSLYVFACVSKIAEKVSSVELTMNQVRNSSGDTEEVFDHPALDLLYRCNPFQTRTEFWQITTINIKCSGEAFWYKVRDARGQVMELWNLRPDLVTTVHDPTAFVKGYELNRPDGTKVTFAPEDIVHFRMPDPLSNYTGTSPLRASKTRIETEEYANRYQRDFFLNSSRPDAVLKTAGSLNSEQKSDIREQWAKRYQGPGKNSKVAVLSGGMEYQLISLSQKEMDFIESQKFNRDDILVAFGVPKSVLGIVEDVNRANAEASYAVFLGETIKPTMEGMVEKINEELVIPDFGERFYVDFEDPTPKNREAERQELDTYVRGNIMLINEAREQLGLAPVRGGWSFYLPISTVPAGGLNSNDQAKMIGGDSRKDAFEAPRARTRKKFNFRGRAKLRGILKFQEQVREELAKEIEKRFKVKTAAKKKSKSMIEGEELRLAYANMMNKQIDAKAKGFYEVVSNYAKMQEERVIEKLGKVKGKKQKISVSIEEIFDVGSENALAIELISPEIMAALESAGEEALDMVAPAEDFDSNARVRNFVDQRARFFAESVNSTTLEGLEKTLAEGIAEAEGIAQLRERVSDVYKDFPSYRAELIARTEATAANNQGLVEGFKQSQVANAKEWINAGDDRVRDEHQNGVGVGGEIVGLDAKFSNGLGYPSEPNCRCVLGPAFLEQ